MRTVIASRTVPGHRITFLRRAGGYWDAGAYRSGDLVYRPRGSSVLIVWDLMPVQKANPRLPGPAPAGYEWVTFELPPDRTETNRGFLSLGVEVE